MRYSSLLIHFSLLTCKVSVPFIWLYQPNKDKHRGYLGNFLKLHQATVMRPQNHLFFVGLEHTKHWELSLDTDNFLLYKNSGDTVWSVKVTKRSIMRSPHSLQNWYKWILNHGIEQHLQICNTYNHLKRSHSAFARVQAFPRLNSSLLQFFPLDVRGELAIHKGNLLSQLLFSMTPWRMHGQSKLLCTPCSSSDESFYSFFNACFSFLGAQMPFPL